MPSTVRDQQGSDNQVRLEENPVGIVQIDRDQYTGVRGAAFEAFKACHRRSGRAVKVLARRQPALIRSDSRAVGKADPVSSSEEGLECV